MKDGDSGQLVECLPSLHGLGFDPQHHLNCVQWCMFLIYLGSRQEDQDLKVSLSCVEEL